jgi:hypothetical protein
MTEPLFNGWTPTTERLCIRCKRTFKSCLYQTCDICRGEDEEARLHSTITGVTGVGDVDRLHILDVDLDAADEYDMASEGYESRMQIRSNLGI